MVNKEKMLNIGCGTDYKEGWVNLDYNSMYNPDIVWDMTKLPLPFKNNTFDKIIMIHVLEHLYNPLDIINELRRANLKEDQNKGYFARNYIT